MAHTIGRSLRSLRHRCDQQVHSMDGNDSPDSDPILTFDRHVSSLLLSLDDADVTSSFLSVPWTSKLLHSLLLLLDDFDALLLSRANLPKCPLLNRLLSDFFDRSVKALDLLNAVRDGLDRVRRLSAQLDIVVPAVAGRRIHRAKKSLGDLSLLLLGETDPVLLPNRHNRSFNRDDPNRRQNHHLRTALSWSVSRTWSAARQLQAMGNNLSPPRPADISGTAGFAIPIFTMGSVLLFVSWALVAAIVPCQDGRGLLHAHLPVPRNYPWAAAMGSLQEKILEEHRKRKGHGGASGLMREICVIEKWTRSLIELLDRSQGEGEEVKEGVRELEEIREGLKEGLEPLERQVREVFHRIVRSRTEGIECLSQSDSRQ